MPDKIERTLVIIKPDGLQRNLLGEVISRFEKKGLKITALKMMQLSDVLLDEHYAHHKDKPFFNDLKGFMKSAPCVAAVLEGYNAISAVRLLVGPTKGYEADAGSIRGDLCISGSSNIVHASDSPENTEKEVFRFFNNDELFKYKKIDYDYLYSEKEKGTE